MAQQGNQRIPLKDKGISTQAAMIALRQVVNRVARFVPQGRIGSIGLEFAREKIHMVQLERASAGHIKVRASTSLAYPGSREALLGSSSTLRSLLRPALRSNPFHGNRIVAALPLPEVRIMSVSYQLSGTQSDEQAILKPISERFKGNLADYVIDYIPVRVGRKEEERLAVVAVAKRDTVIAYLELLRRAALRVEALEIGPVAIQRLVSTFSEMEEHQNVLAINFGHELSYMTMISGRRLLFDQQIDFGEKGLIDQLAETLEMDTEAARGLVYQYGLWSQTKQRSGSAEISNNDVTDSLMEIVKPGFLALVEEIKRALIYAASETRGEPVKKVYLLGSIARWRGADRLLNDLLDIPVMNITDPLSVLDQGGVPESMPSDSLAPEIAVATGLALRGVVQDG
jgi:type IV pilus assembly protein PilM